ncbi:macrophage mannose receptor 1-like [Mugil cephalus]|uniref:macrophage mannose receptor 1-like n=1 Tax=Mugil cephalus TaxID=48193 RepID=UPI001FB75CCD|nr:macrophage mannose receptor 1-like [Mugil cephalus]XP_047437262.1 macrophage mannose receptor 1-like [Mugil cephalus]
MQWSLLIVMGQCYFITCQLYQYHYIEDTKTWTEAQEYCREHYTDLATVSNMTDMKRLLGESTGRKTEAWIGLNNRTDVNRTWHWSLPGVEFKDDVTRWKDGEPNDGYGNIENCVGIRKHIKLIDFPCISKKTFLCYNESGSTKIHLIKEEKNWIDAQKYCRDHHTDLVSGLNQLDQVGLNDTVKDIQYWIGLFRDTWRWSDGSSSSFRHWDQTLSPGDKCAVTMLNEGGRWRNANCTDQNPFSCYDDKMILIKENKTWEEALYYCRENYNDLVSINNLDEQRWVQERAKKASTPFVWLGLRYTCTLDFWFWVSDEVVSYKNWASDGKNDDCDMSGAMETGGEHQWVTKQDNEKFNFICAV